MTLCDDTFFFTDSQAPSRAGLWRGDRTGQRPPRRGSGNSTTSPGVTWTDPRRAGRDDVAGKQRHHGAVEADQERRRVNAVDLAQRLGKGDDLRAEREEAGEVLSPDPPLILVSFPVEACCS